MTRSITGKLVDTVYDLTGLRIGVDDFPATRGVESAVASLLAMVALSDGSVSPEESERLVVILRKHFDLEAGTALALITEAIHELPDREAMTNLIGTLNNSLSVRNKETLIIMLLEVIVADGRKEIEEMEVLANAVYGLGLSSRSMDRAYRVYFSSRRGRVEQARSSPQI